MTWVFSKAYRTAKVALEVRGHNLDFLSTQDTMVAPTPPSTSTTPLPATFSPSKAKKALTALLAHHAKTLSSREDTELLPREEHIWLIINTKRGTTRAKLMPVRMYVSSPCLLLLPLVLLFFLLSYSAN